MLATYSGSKSVDKIQIIECDMVGIRQGDLRLGLCSFLYPEAAEVTYHFSVLGLDSLFSGVKPFPEPVRILSSCTPLETPNPKTVHMD